MIDKNKLNELLVKFTVEMKRIFEDKLVQVILYGSYATGNQEDGSDIDVMVLVEVDKISIKEYREEFADILFKLDFEYDVLLSPIIQNYEEFKKYKNASGFFKNVVKQGVEISA